MLTKITPIFLTLLLLFTIGCSGEGIQAFQDSTALQEKLKTQYGWQGVSVTISNGFALGISFLNSPFNQLDRATKQAKAREIATFVKQNYNSIDQISQIFVGFVRYEKLYGIIDFTNSLDTFFFDVNELAPPTLAELLTPDYKTVFVIKASPNTLATQFFASIGFAGIFFGVVIIAASIYFARKRKENAIYLGVLFGIVGLLFGSMFLIFGTLFTTMLGTAQNKYLTAYTQQKYQIVEGSVKVISEQSRDSRGKGDIVQVGDKTFEITHTQANPFGQPAVYQQTLAYGGVLRNGVYARVYYVDNSIVRIDVKKP